MTSSHPFWPDRQSEGARIATFVQERLAGAHNDILYVCGNCGCGKTSTVRQLEAHALFAKPANDDAKKTKKASSQAVAAPAMRQATMCYLNCGDLTATMVLEELQAAFARSEKRRGKASTATRSSSGHKSPLEALRASVHGRVRDPNYERMWVLVLDEVETARPSGAAELKALVETCLAHGELSVAVIIISNSKGLFAADPRRLRSITFEPYTTAALTSIAARWAEQWAAALAPATIAVAAKTVTATYNGDVRKMEALCLAATNAAKRDAAAATIAAASGHTSGVDDGKNINKNGGSKRHRPETKTAAATASQPHPTVATVSHLRAAVNDAPSSAVSVIRALPQQMLLLLCTAYAAHRKKLESQHAAKLSGASVTTQEVRGLFLRAAQSIGLSMHSSVAETQVLLANLADQGLLSQGGKTGAFAVCVHDSEMAEVLKTTGTTYDLARTIVAHS